MGPGARPPAQPGIAEASDQPRVNTRHYPRAARWRSSRMFWRVIHRRSAVPKTRNGAADRRLAPKSRSDLSEAALKRIALWGQVACSGAG